MNINWSVSVTSDRGYATVDLDESDIATGFLNGFNCMIEHMDDPVSTEIVWASTVAPFLCMAVVLFDDAIGGDPLESVNTAVIELGGNWRYNRTEYDPMFRANVPIIQTIQGPALQGAALVMDVPAGERMVPTEDITKEGVGTGINKRLPHFEDIVPLFSDLSKNDKHLIYNQSLLVRGLLMQMTRTFGVDDVGDL